MKTSSDLRARRKERQRFKISRVSPGKVRLCVNRTNQHTYAQVVSADGKTLASASTMTKSASALKNGSNIAAAEFVGKAIAELAVKAGITEVVFDRSGFLYHGRIKALADAARANGLQF
jgi:large subunit ribosomal protein L18